MWRSGNETVRRVEGLEFYSGRRLFLFVFFYSSSCFFVSFSGYAATGYVEYPATSLFRYLLPLIFAVFEGRWLHFEIDSS